MRFASFSHKGRAAWGAVTDHGIIPLTDLAPNLQFALHDLPRIADLAAARRPDLSPQDVTWTIPLHAPEKILCVGVNYPDRNAEYKDGSDAPTHMSLFPRFARSFTGHNQPLIRPPESPQLDYEGEVAVIIGKPGRRIAEQEALSHIAALTLANEGTIRDWVRHAKFNVTQGKNWDRSGSIGPWIVPYSDESQMADIALQTRVNGDLRQSDRTSRMLFSFRQIIAYISTFTTLQTGDILLCGTPTGAGARHDPPIWLKPGDVVEVHAQGIGTLTNPIADEAT